MTHALAFLAPLPTGSGITFDPRYVIGDTTALSTALKPRPATFAPGLKIPYLKPRATGLPIKEKPPPINAPSAPNLTLFLNLARAKSLPVNPLVFSSFTTKVFLSGVDAIKSVAAKALAMYPALFAIWDVFWAMVPVAAALLLLWNILSLFNILNAAPPGIPYCVRTLVISPVNVSGSFILFSSYISSNLET